MKISLLLLFFLLQFSLELQAQKKDGEQARQEALALLETAKAQMSKQDFESANKSFHKMLELNTVLPTEMCYFFSSTLYRLGQYDNSLRFAEKYLSLAGPGGEFYQESQELKELLKEEMRVIRTCQYCDSHGYVLEDCRYCEGEGKLLQSCSKCYGHQRIKCELCKGEGVVIEKNSFGQKNYQSCQRCEGSGIQTCFQCEGEGTLSRNCQYCHGSGRIRTHQLCQHPRASN